MQLLNFLGLSRHWFEVPVHLWKVLGQEGVADAGRTAWAHEYSKAAGIKLNYQSIGSGGGQRQIVERTVDFGASDDLLTSNRSLPFLSIGTPPTRETHFHDPGRRPARDPDQLLLLRRLPRDPEKDPGRTRRCSSFSI